MRGPPEDHQTGQAVTDLGNEALEKLQFVPLPLVPETRAVSSQGNR